MEAAHRRIFTEGIWGSGGLRDVHCTEDMAALGDIGAAMMGMEAFELVVDDVRIVRPLGATPTGAPAGQVAIRAGDRQVGHAAWWYPGGAVRPGHSQYFSGLSAAISDAVERIHQTDALAAAATRDLVTSLLNRRGLNEAMARFEHAPYTVGLIDVDDFKAVSTRLGLAGGDSVLVQIAALLGDSREEDLVCRWGGEEFLLVLPEVTAQGAVARIERLLSQSMADVAVREKQPVSCSCGVASSWPGATIAEVVHRADDALRRAKAQGKARVLIRDAAAA